MKIAWATDIHLNFLTLHKRELFYNKLKLEKDISAIIISGDIGEYPVVIDYLKELEENFSLPILYVLGNHDYYTNYNDPVETIRKSIRNLKLENVKWLTNESPYILNDKTIIVGVDSWADGREGNWEKTHVRMNDDNYIFDLKIQFTHRDPYIYKKNIIMTRQKLADEDAKILNKSLEKGINNFNPEKIIVVTHIPPFKEGAIYNNEISDANHLPFYCSQVIGELLINYAKKYPNIEFLALAGHSHGNAEYSPLPNLKCRTQEAIYSYPNYEKITI